MHERNQVWNKFGKSNKIQSQVEIITLNKKIDKHTHTKDCSKGVVVCSYVSTYNYRCH